jgi:hypothetical protein
MANLYRFVKIRVWCSMSNNPLMLPVDRGRPPFGGMGYSGAEVARFVGVTTSAVNRLAVSEELPGFRKYLNAL